jgi:hypothetical protein
MSIRTKFSRFGIALLACASAFALPVASFAADGHGGGGHGGGGGFHGGGSHAGGGGHVGPAFHGSPGNHAAYVHGPGGHYYGGHYAGRPYYGGRPYWGYGRGYGYRGWYGGLALGAFVATLPLYYNTYWWGGVPYYYYDDTYYRYDRDVGQYEVVAPPPEAATATQDAPSTSNSSSSLDLYAYPKNGQTEEQQKSDRYECHRWAAGQTGFDPTEGTTNQAGSKAGDYRRAETACLNARGYSVQ